MTCGSPHPDRENVDCERPGDHAGPHAAGFDEEQPGVPTPRIVWGDVHNGPPDGADWTISDVEDDDRLAVDRLAAYRCEGCEAIVPMSFTRDTGRPPQRLAPNVCPDRFGGCGRRNKFRLVGGDWVRYDYLRGGL